MTTLDATALQDAGPGTLYGGRGGTVRSYDHHGAVFCWEPPLGLALRRAALDVEALDQPGAAGMSARFGLPNRAFLERWTATEAIAKVLDVPILDLLRQQGLARAASEAWSLDPAGVWLRALPHPTHCVTVAVVL